MLCWTASERGRGGCVSAQCDSCRKAIAAPRRWSERSAEAEEPTGAREQVCGPDMILTASVKGAREGARVKIMSVGCPQTAGRASRSGAGLAIGRRGAISENHFWGSGATDWDRTSNLRLRRPTLYPVELQSRWLGIIPNITVPRCLFFARAPP